MSTKRRHDAPPLKTAPLPVPLPAQRTGRLAIYCAVILCVTAVSFLPSLRNGITNWDDDFYFKDPYLNDIRSGFTMQGIAKVFSLSSIYLGNYQPLTMLSYMADYRLFHLNPSGYHCTNLALHCINALLLFALIYGLIGNGSVAFIASMLFAVHPLRVESVAWIAERKDVLFSLFYLLSLLFYLRYVKTGRWLFWSFSLALLALSLLSKPMAVTLPLALLLIDYLQKRKFTAKMLLVKLPFFAAAGACGLEALLAQKSAGALQTAAVLLPVQRLCNPFYQIVFYLVKFIAPVHLSAMYPFPEKMDGLRNMEVLLSPVAVLVAGAALFFRRLHPRKVQFGLLFFVVTLLPVLQVVPFGSAIAADRYTYIPGIGICFLVATGFDYCIRKRLESNHGAQKALRGAAIVFLAILVCLTFQRCKVWKDSVTLWNDVLSKYPRTAVAFNNRGYAYYLQKGYDSAIRDFNRAIQLSPSYSQAYNNRGVTYMDKGADSSAVANYSEAIALNSTYAEAYFNRGKALINLGQYDRAISDLNVSLRLKPAFALAFIHRGFAECRMGLNDQAIGDFSKAIDLNLSDRDAGDAYNDRGYAFMNQGHYDEAIRDFSRAIVYNPGDSAACENRARADRLKGRGRGGSADLHGSATSIPDDAIARYNQGIQHLAGKEFEAAIADFTRALQLNPAFAEAYGNRGISYCEKGMLAAGIKDFDEAIKLKPSYIAAVNNRNLAMANLQSSKKVRHDFKIGSGRQNL